MDPTLFFKHFCLSKSWAQFYFLVEQHPFPFLNKDNNNKINIISKTIQPITTSY